MWVGGPCGQDLAEQHVEIELFHMNKPGAAFAMDFFKVPRPDLAHTHRERERGRQGERET
jgi:hypothetical protein